ncbi:hypothetical protein [Burkholderia gladioli]|uniref:hypothetical protein n=1 Tax=Burkholderia gladioli TaxID=28095 RepID=UPI0016416AF2|nr:hypothetical protein [Burkholderia gladioli]
MLELRNARIALWTDVPRGATVAMVRGRRPARRRHGKTGGGIQALAVTWSAAATVAAAVLELRNAHIAPWLGVPRGAAVAPARGRRPARRRRGKTGGGIRALTVTRSAAATVAIAALERRNARIAPWLGIPRGAAAATVAVAALVRRNARIAPWLGIPRGAAIATVHGRRPARRRHGENRRRCSGADGDPVGGRDGGGRRARAAQCAHCALAGRSARGGGRGSSRAAARAARARENRWRPSGAGDSDGPCGDGGARPAVETVASAPPESCLTLRRRIPLHCAARGRGKME